MSFRTEHLTPPIADAPDDLLRLTSVGLFQSLGNFRWEMVAWRLALHCFHEGHGVFIEDGQTYLISPGDCFLQQPGRHYRYYDQPGEPWRYDFLTLEGRVLPEWLPASSHFSATPEIWNLVAEATHAFRKDAVPIARAARLGWTMIELMRPPDAVPGVPDLVETLTSIAERRDDVVPTVGQIARDLGMDRTTLYRRFREATGGPIKPWLDKLRMARAEELLRHSNAPIREIAAICGFRDPMYFSRAFRTRHGVPPGQWRKTKTRPDL